MGHKTDDMIERNSVNVKLHDVDPTALRQLIDYAYTGEITISEDNVQVKAISLSLPRNKNITHSALFYCFFPSMLSHCIASDLPLATAYPPKS